MNTTTYVLMFDWLQKCY